MAHTYQEFPHPEEILEANDQLQATDMGITSQGLCQHQKEQSGCFRSWVRAKLRQTNDLNNTCQQLLVIWRQNKPLTFKKFKGSHTHMHVLNNTHIDKQIDTDKYNDSLTWTSTSAPLSHSDRDKSLLKSREAGNDKLHMRHMTELQRTTEALPETKNTSIYW